MLTRQRMSVEARVLGRLQLMDFPSPSLHDFDFEAGWMVLSRLGGRPLCDALRDGSAGLDEVRSVGALIRRLHETGFSHGDMTTHNILVDGSGGLSPVSYTHLTLPTKRIV